MRLNIISTHRNQTGLAQDVDILQGIWTAADENVKFRRIHVAHPECEEAEYNVSVSYTHLTLPTIYSV